MYGCLFHKQYKNINDGIDLHFYKQQVINVILFKQSNQDEQNVLRLLLFLALKGGIIYVYLLWTKMQSNVESDLHVNNASYLSLKFTVCHYINKTSTKHHPIWRQAITTVIQESPMIQRTKTLFFSHGVSSCLARRISSLFIVCFVSSLVFAVLVGVWFDEGCWSWCISSVVNEWDTSSLDGDEMLGMLLVVSQVSGCFVYMYFLR